MHNLTGRDLANTREARLRDIDRVITECARTALLTDLRRHRGVVHVLDLQKLALLVIQREKTILEDALANLAHQLVVESDVMLPQQGPA